MIIFHFNLQENYFQLKWEPLSSEESMGKVIGYNIFAKTFSGSQRFSSTQKVPFKNGTASKAIVELPKGENLKIWITALTSKGEGPRSNEWTVFADDLHYGVYLHYNLYVS